MSKQILILSSLLWVNSVAYALPRVNHSQLNASVEKQVLQHPTTASKPFYNDTQTAQLCENWPVCAHWALNQYQKDPTFKVLNARLKTQRSIYRHYTRVETHLYVQAIQANKIINLVFTAPQTSRRGKPYRVISNFPLD